MIQYKTLVGGKIKNGMIYGQCEMYSENPVSGVGEIWIGNFIDNKLNDNDGIYISYTSNMQIYYYRGAFIKGVMTGQISIVEFNTLAELNEDEKLEIGNGNHNFSQRWMYNSNNVVSMSGIHINQLYNNGTPGTINSSNSCEFTINVSHKILNKVYYFNKFYLLFEDILFIMY